MEPYDDVLPYFVYGTLMSGQRNHDAHFPAEAVAGVEVALVPGVAVWTHHIPFAVQDEASIALGQIITLRPDLDAATAQAVRDGIDRLEGFDAADPDGSWYRKVRVAVGDYSARNSSRLSPSRPRLAIVRAASAS